MIAAMVRPGDVVYDVGAHIGSAMVAFREAVGDSGAVYACEANGDLIPTLLKTAAQWRNVEVCHVAGAERDATGTLYVTADTTMSSLGAPADGCRLARIGNCPLRRLDTVVREHDWRRPDLVKIDVEGAEAAVLEGAHGLLDREDAPVVVFEENRVASEAFGVQIQAAPDFLTALSRPGYELTRINAGEKGYVNVVATPEARAAHRASR